MTDPLSRFVVAQAGVYPTVLRELRAGRKQTHWMWFVFPQLRGLGHSATAQRYGLDGAAEARAFDAHPLLGPRLRDGAALLLDHADRPIATILGEVDAMKLRSCATLFQATAATPDPFAALLTTFFDGRPCARTLDLLATAERS